MVLVIRNRDARHLWLHSTGLLRAPTGRLDLLGLIRRLGFVQIDTIRNVTRAHHHILWSRNQNYREPMLWRALGRDRALFEHFTHDASLLPIEYYPMWQRQFQRMAHMVAQNAWYHSGITDTQLAAIRDRIRADGPLATHAFDTKVDGEKAMWSRPPHKKALDAMWYAGELCTSHRENFIKFYDFADRVIPVQHRNAGVSDAAQIDWLCGGALDRLGFATPGEIRRFWDATNVPETRRWIDSNTASLETVEVEMQDGGRYLALAPADIRERITALQSPCPRLRLLNPFDPAIRDRKRLSRLFGFEYRNEMFVPKAKRRWGYYVYPLLERDRFVGRIELRGNRETGRLTVAGFWQEPGTRWGAARKQRLGAELVRFGRLAGLAEVEWPKSSTGTT